MRQVGRHRDRERAHDKFAPVDWVRYPRRAGVSEGLREERGLVTSCATRPRSSASLSRTSEGEVETDGSAVVGLSGVGGAS